MKVRKSFLRLLQEPRGRIVQLLRRRPYSVSELAEALKRTRNAVRIQLAKMESEGLVRRAGKRAGYRKPEYVFELAPEAEQLFHRAYGPLVDHLLSVFGERMSDSELMAALDTIALRLADRFPAPSPDTSTTGKAESAVAVVEALGGAADLEQSDGELSIRGWSCPFSEVSPGHPELCAMVARLLAEVTGLTVRDRCERTPGAPHCAFQVAA